MPQHVFEAQRNQGLSTQTQALKKILYIPNETEQTESNIDGNNFVWATSDTAWQKQLFESNEFIKKNS